MISEKKKKSAILRLAFFLREAITLLQSAAGDFKEWVFSIHILPCLCHPGYWGDMVNTLTYIAYLCFWERLHPHSGLQVTGKAFAFYLKKMTYVQRQGCNLRLRQRRAGSS